MNISVVIPLFNEDESLPELFAWIERVTNAHGLSHEVIFVDDGSTDRSWEVIEKLRAERPDVVRGIKFRRNYGKSPALYCGFAKAEGDVVITMDADLQDSPDEIPELYRMICEDGYDLVSGYKMNRSKGDPLSKTIPTKLFNATARWVSGIHNLHDFNCGLKAYRREVIKNIEVYGEMHRYIPYLAKNAGFARIGEKPVHHQARKFGKSKFMGWNRFVNGYLDLLSLWFLNNFGLKPMHVFGFIGTLMFLLGFVAVIIVGATKLYYLSTGEAHPLVTDNPYFYIALTMMLLGTQLFVAGFLVNSLIGASKLELPLSYSQDADTLVLRIYGEEYDLSDTLWVEKTNTPHFESPDCPTTMFHQIKSVRHTSTFIDSVTITRNLVDYDQTENIRIHL